MNYSIILMAGSSTRSNTDLPKQFIKINNKEIYLYSFDIFNKHPLIDKIILVCDKNYVDIVKSQVLDNEKVEVIEGGSTRQSSSKLALDFIKNNEKDTSNINVLIHDAARPMVNTRIIDDCLNNLDEFEAVATAIKTNDSTVIKTNNNNIKEYLNRDEVYSLQTPQGFRFDKIYEAHNLTNKTDVKDDASLYLEFNKNVKLIEGDSYNFKITNFNDLILFERLIEAK